MAVRVVTVANPAVGHDWSYVVPGQWQANLLGIQATLTTPASITTLADSGPNNLPLTTPLNGTGITVGATGPFGGSPNRSIHNGPPSGGSLIGKSAQSALFATANWSFDGWFYWDGTLDISNGSMFFDLFYSPGSSRWATYLNGTGAQPVSTRDFAGASFIRTKTVTFTAGTWHHFACTWDGTTVLEYVDGVQVISWGADSGAAGGTVAVAIGGLDTAALKWQGKVAGCAVYGVTLSAGQISTHAGAGSSAATYKATVLADSPVALWMLDDVGSMGSRTVDLTVADGTNKILDVPASFTFAVSNAAVWSWQTLGSGAIASADGTTNAVPIPALNLPAGYVLGTRTLDIQTADQWSAITLWFDDGTGGGPLGGWPAAKYLDAHLVLVPKGTTT